MEKIWSLTTWSLLSERNTNRSDTMWSCCLNCGKHGILWFSSVHSVKSNPCGPMDCSTSGFPVHHQPPEFAQTHVHQVSDAIQSSHPLSCSSPPAFNLFQHQGLFQWVTSLHQMGKVLEFQLQHQSFHEYSGLISFSIGRFDLLAVQGTLKSLPQDHTSKASVLQGSPIFIVQLSHPYMTTGKTIALTRWTFVGKVMSLLSNMLSKLVIAFLSKNKCLLISWLQSPSAVILELKKIKCHCFHCFSIYLPWRDETGCHDLRFLNVEF